VYDKCTVWYSIDEKSILETLNHLNHFMMNYIVLGSE